MASGHLSDLHLGSVRNLAHQQMPSEEDNIRNRSVPKHLFADILSGGVFAFKIIEIILPKLELGSSKEAPKQRWEVSVDSTQFLCLELPLPSDTI